MRGTNRLSPEQCDLINEGYSALLVIQSAIDMAYVLDMQVNSNTDLEDGMMQWINLKRVTDHDSRKNVAEINNITKNPTQQNQRPGRDSHRIVMSLLRSSYTSAGCNLATSAHSAGCCVMQ